VELPERLDQRGGDRVVAAACAERADLALVIAACEAELVLRQGRVVQLRFGDVGHLFVLDVRAGLLLFRHVAEVALFLAFAFVVPFGPALALPLGCLFRGRWRGGRFLRRRWRRWRGLRRRLRRFGFGVGVRQVLG